MANAPLVRCHGSGILPVVQSHKAQRAHKLAHNHRCANIGSAQQAATLPTLRGTSRATTTGAGISFVRPMPRDVLHSIRDPLELGNHGLQVGILTVAAVAILRRGAHHGYVQMVVVCPPEPAETERNV